MSKNMEKRLPQLYYIKTKFLMIWVLLHYWGHHGNAMTALRFLFIFVFLFTWSFFKGSLKGVCPCHNCLNYGKVWTNLWDGFGNILKWSFKSHKNIKIACYPHNWLIFKKMISFGNAASSPSGLIPLKTAFKNFALFKKLLYKFFYKLPHSKVNHQ